MNERRIHVAAWRRRAIAATALAASIAGIWLTSHIALTPPTPVIAKVDPPVMKPDVRITFAKESNVIAVPIESDNPNVTIVMVYQAVRPTPKNRM